MTLLHWHNYKYYPYEQVLAERELAHLLTPDSFQQTENGIKVCGNVDGRNIDRLVYFSGATRGGESTPTPTRQALLERVNGNGSNRQATRYSAHGLHEYKGKFNPQIAKFLLNILGPTEQGWALDPFCGSGTSLIEAAHLNMNAVGTDINPLAVFLANSKISALSIPAADIVEAATSALNSARKNEANINTSNARWEYLQSWFPEDILKNTEKLRIAINNGAEASRNVLLAIASNLLRDYSLQEPSDLRIRRRTSPFPTIGYLQAFDLAVKAFSKKLADSQAVLGLLKPNTYARQLDCRQSLLSSKHSTIDGFDVALTSPPYATALPYIDTQRLSLVWLDLLAPMDILPLEATLVGSREIRGRNKSDLLDALMENEAKLPKAESDLCIELQQHLTENDGFRRQAVPRLLYRYFAGMADSFTSVKQVMKPGANYGLIVGGNHTVLSGRRFDINTPKHLANLAVSRGWTHLETLELQTYKRYGLHAKNAGTTEALVILRA